MGPVRRPMTGRLLRNHIRSYVILFLCIQQIQRKNDSQESERGLHRPLWPRYRFLVTYVPRRPLRSSCLPLIRSNQSPKQLNAPGVLGSSCSLPKARKGSNRDYSISKGVKIRNESSIVWIVSMSDKHEAISHRPSSRMNRISIPTHSVLVQTFPSHCLA